MVRRGLAGHVVDRTIAHVDVAHPRAVRRHIAGGDDFAARLVGRTITAARRRGKYLWLELDGCDRSGDAGPARSGHDAASLDAAAAAPSRRRGARAPRDERADARRRRRPAGREAPADPDRVRRRRPELRFVDQRTFGGLSLHPLVPAAGGGLLPAPIAHIARDPMDPAFSLDDAVAAIRRRRTELKRALLDQTAVSGIGNIYADEALWRARLHGARPTEKLTRAQGRAVLTAADAGHGRGAGAGRDVVRRAVRQRQRRVGLLRPVAGRVRAGGPPLPALRHPDPPRAVHEPRLVLLPALPAPAARRLSGSALLQPVVALEQRPEQAAGPTMRNSANG